MSDYIPVVPSALLFSSPYKTDFKISQSLLVIFSLVGANQIELGNGQIIKLERLTRLERAGKAKMLLSSPGVIVHRHLLDGDGHIVR